MKAEALNELNRVDEALTPLNAVRKRARESYLYDQDLPGAGVVPPGLLPDIANNGQAAVRAAIRHAGLIRLRPILMTTFCTLFGLLPLALVDALRTKGVEALQDLLHTQV